MSPYELLQEIYNEHPWQMLICCILLNQTNRKHVDKIRHNFFKRYPTPEDVRSADIEEIADLISPLGFKNRRSLQIYKFSMEFIGKDWIDPIELYGIGQYGQDSWDIFQKGNIYIKPKDEVLKTYLIWARESKPNNESFVKHVKRMNDAGAPIENSELTVLER